MLEVRAKSKYIRTSQQKAGLVLDLIRGKQASEALAILRFTKKSVARDIEKALRSAIANAVHVAMRSVPPVAPALSLAPPEPERVQSVTRAAARQEAPPAAAPRPAGANGSSELATENARAERLARIIVSDIVLYNPEKFALAIRNGNVLEALDSELHEGRAHFRERIPERVRERRDFLGDELVRVARQRGMK